MKIACIQHSYKSSSEETIDFVMKKIGEASKKGAKIICLEELFSLPYFCRTIDPSHFALAESKEGPLYRIFSEAALRFDVVLIVPFFEKRLNGLYNNSAMVFDAGGKLLGIYRKQHIPDDPCFYEKYYFAEGDLGYKVFKTKYGAISVLICWDQWYPEAARTAALKGAEILFYPTAIGIIKGEEKQEGKFLDAWKTIQRSHAIANGVFVASVNRTGREGELSFWGNSFICDPLAEVLASAKKEEKILYAEVDLSQVGETRSTWPFLRDRRIDTYKEVLTRASEENFG